MGDGMLDVAKFLHDRGAKKTGGFPLLSSLDQTICGDESLYFWRNNSNLNKYPRDYGRLAYNAPSKR